MDWYTAPRVMYRAGVECFSDSASVDRSSLRSVHPRGWPGFQITFRYRASRYEVTVETLAP